MSIFDQHASGVQAKVRLGRHGRDRINWNPPQDVSLFLQHDPKGRCCIVAVQERSDFAEFDPRHHTETATLLCAEDYALEVLELPLGTPVIG